MITDEPWSFSMQFKNYFWFELQKTTQETEETSKECKTIEIGSEDWMIPSKKIQNSIKDLLYSFIRRSKWFKGNVRKLRDINIMDVFPLNSRKIPSYLFMIQMDLIDENKEIFLMPVSLAQNNRMLELRSKHPDAVIANVNYDNDKAILYDGVHDHLLLDKLFSIIQKRSKLKGINGEIEGSSGSRLRKLKPEEMPLKPNVVAFRRNNASITFGYKYFFRMYRSLQEGENPDLEIIKKLTRHSDFKNIPPYVGRLDYKHPDFEDTSIALLVDLIPNAEDAWEMFQTAIDSFFDKILSEKEEIEKLNLLKNDNLEEIIGPFFIEMTALMGKRTAELHHALNSVKEVKGFEPEPFSLLYQKSLYQSMRTFVKRTFSHVKPLMADLDADLKNSIDEIIADQDLYFSYIQNTLEKAKIATWKTRIHGNYKLDKLLFTGKDFIFTDFEGEVEYPLSVRKLKHCPLKDVASMISSFYYAIHMGYSYRKEFSPADESYLNTLMEKWFEKLSTTFLDAYLDDAKNYGFIPENSEQTQALLNLFIFEKAIQEISKFITIQPESLVVPIGALKKIRQEITG